MGKGKPRHNPDKPQNNYPTRCPYYDSCNGVVYCEGGYTGAAKVCKGNRHNCIKTKYHLVASLKQN